MNQAGSDGSGYRVGTLDTPLQVFETTNGDVYLDPDGGGHLFAEACEAMEEYARRNGFADGGATCLDGALPIELLER